MRLLDLFSGIGGFSLAAEWIWEDELEIAGFCEIEKYCQKVLKKNFPGIPIYEDIKKLNGKDFKNIDLITGGFPCTDISIAGQGKGLIDEEGKTTRSGLWFEMHRIIREIRPRFALIENVPMLTIRGGTRVISDLAEIGYDAEWTIMGADDVGAWHRRKRIWIVCYESENTISSRCLDREPQEERVEIGKLGKSGTGGGEWIYGKGKKLAYPNDKRVRTRIGGTDVYNEKESGTGDYNGGGGTGDVERNNPETPKNEKMEFPNTHNTRDRTSRFKIDKHGKKKTQRPERKTSRSQFKSGRHGKDVPDPKQGNVQAGCERRRKICEVGEGERISDNATCSSKDISDSNAERLQGGEETRNDGKDRKESRDKLTSRRNREREGWDVEPKLGRVAHGIPKRVDRLKGLGNAIVPQCAAVIMEKIKKTMEAE